MQPQLRQQVEKSELQYIKQRYPDRIPVLVACKNGIELTKYKYLTSANVTISQFQHILRQKITNGQNSLKPSEGLFMFVNNTMCPATDSMEKLFKEHQKDGVLSVTLCKENTFGLN